MNTRYNVKYKRRREGKTNYRKRAIMLSSNKKIVVFRKLSRTLIGQIVKFDTKGDIVVASVSSKELEKYGWKLSKKNVPAAYLTGFLLAKKANNLQNEELIINLGILSPTKGSTKFAFIKGAIDGGLKIIHSPELFPGDERITGKHIENYAISSKNKIVFSKTPESKNISKIFEEVKRKIGV